MYITIQSGIIDDETHQHNELTGKAHYEDEQVDVIEHRIMVGHIIDWHPKYKQHELCWVYLVDGRSICALESAESVENKIKKALITPATN